MVVKTQSAFVPGLSIVDNNVLVAFAGIHAMSRKI